MNPKSLLITLFIVFAINNTHAQDYFPMVKGSYWVYNVYFDGVFQNVDSVVYNKGEVIHDTAFYKFEHHYLENNSVASVDTYFLYKNYTDSNTIMWSNRNFKKDIIDSAVYAKHNYTDGDWWIPQKNSYPIDTVKVKLIGDITVTAGTFANCFKQGDEYFFAPNIGIVKIVLWNTQSYYDLIKYHIPLLANNIAHFDSKYHHIPLYPNPTTDFIIISGINNASYKITTSAGQLVKSGVISNGNINMSSLLPGLYLVFIQNGGNNYVEKIIKK